MLGGHSASRHLHCATQWKVTMPMIIKNDFRSVNEMLDQLQAQLLAERAQHAFNVAGLEKQIAILLKELAEARLELARRDSRAALVNAPSAPAMTH